MPRATRSEDVGAPHARQPSRSCDRTSRFRPSGRSGSRRRTLLERLLSFFADVRAGGGRRRGAADAERLPAARRLLAAEAGARRLDPHRGQRRRSTSYSAAAQAVLLMGVVPLYGWLGSRVVRIRLISTMLLFFAGDARGLLRRWARSGVREGVAFYIWLGHHQRLHRLAVLGLRQRPLHGRPGPAVVSVDRRGRVARRVGRRGVGRPAWFSGSASRRTR